MVVIAIFIGLVVVSDTIAVFICSLIERVSEHASLIAFLIFYAGNFVLAWHLAVYITERYLMKDEREGADVRAAVTERVSARR
jgi:hypothetical protein